MAHFGLGLIALAAFPLALALAVALPEIREENIMCGNVMHSSIVLSPNTPLKQLRW